MKNLAVICVLLYSSILFANSAPEVTNVQANQRTDGSGIVEISYTLSDADGDACQISAAVSDDGGETYSITPTDLSGDTGGNITPGSRTIYWNSKADLPGEYGENYRVKITADDGQSPEGPAGMVWVYIDDPGVSGHEGFTGYMSKYETTNAQYCQYLNDALASGDIEMNNYNIYGSSGDYSGQIYYDMDDTHAQISYSDGSFYVKTRDGYDMSDHPVVEVSWYGAIGFCEYYGYRLPTEWEWQAAADYDGSYTYGCGTSIDHSKANYDDDNPLGLSGWPYTTPVGYYPAFGYGLCDMAGNAWEWTNSIYSDNYRVLRGGSWYYYDYNCSVSYRFSYVPYYASYGGIRAVRP
ncbi:formylglycine-generating enzyme family protein [Sedimentisphaera salicampi]|uniref:Serine/threonine-protein kinase pkn1 n=1 Tax=Sedimentisphaera salicampi TaxID=1941349 RepID=A0A1W6LLE6_9BACT|nr:formylglycine-generating enzyme family protein [Sedimentisphaera salicampi]ARN56576.1 Serine/threonine-protein kinase pkn1 [Sedimentisphaera salicampi]